MQKEQKRRKYRIAALLAEYDEATQREMIEELSKKLGIGTKMFSHYMYVTVDSDKLNMGTDKLQTIAQFFKVNDTDILNKSDKETQKLATM